jgi:hypothetical protein
VVRRSARVARAVAVRSPAGVALRDVTLALAGRLPESALARGAAPIFAWQPPGALTGDHPGSL